MYVYENKLDTKMFPLLSNRWLTCTTNPHIGGGLRVPAVHDGAMVDIFQKSSAGWEHCVTYERSERGLPPQSKSQKTRKGASQFDTHYCSLSVSPPSPTQATHVFQHTHVRRSTACTHNRRQSENITNALLLISDGRVIFWASFLRPLFAKKMDTVKYI